MPISAEEKNFNERVKNAPITQEILDDLDGLKRGQGKLEDKMESLEKKVDNGFERLSKSLDTLTDEIRSEKEKALLESNQELKAELKRKRTNKDTVKNGGLIAMVTTVAGFILENMGIINIVGQ